MNIYKSYMKIMCAVLVFIPSISLAGVIVNPATCSVQNATLNSIKLTDGLPDSGELLSTSYNATSCVGVYGENDDSGGLSNPNPNIGELYDGILNGEDILSGLEFITAADLQDLDGDGDNTDPGWIHLASVSEGGAVNYSNAGPSYISDLVLDIGDLLTLDFECLIGAFGDCSSLSWTLTTKLDIIEQVEQLLGNASFDHLAFSVKAGSDNSGGGFAIYDFNFNEIFALENNPALNFETPYKLAGTLNTLDLQGKGFSHLNVWARDPQTSNNIPEPTGIVIFSFGLFLLAMIRRNRA